MKCVLCNSENFKIITKKIRDNIECNVVQCLSCNLVSLENHTKNIIDYDKSYRKTHSPILGKQLSPSEFFDYELPFQEPRVKRIKSLLNLNMDVLEIGSSAGHFLYSRLDSVPGDCRALVHPGIHGARPGLYRWLYSQAQRQSL